MPDRSFLNWPFFEDRHRALAEQLDTWCARNLPVDHHDVDAACRELVAMLGRDGWLKPTALDPDNPGPLDVRTLCITRETLARHDGLADFAFAMQGLGTGAISLFGAPEQQRWLAKTRAGRAISAFALSEPRSGSDVANMEMTAVRDGDDYVLSGEKTWISNGGIADLYVVFARTGEAPGAKGISAFVVPADTEGLAIAERLEVIAPHPLARLSFDNARVPASALIPPCRYSMCFVRRWGPLLSASRGARSTKASNGWPSGNCSARRWPSCRWCRATSPTWRWMSMQPPC
jgi:acyl-CoA dehydrogenase